MAEEKPGEATGTTAPVNRRTADGDIAGAIDLGWRVAALHALSPTTLQAPSEVNDGMLLNRRSLPPGDRLELEVQAVAGVAKALGIPFDEAEVASLVELAQKAADSGEEEEAFRAELARRHVAFDKQLWTYSEQSGKAYELGNFMSDTWNRVARPRLKDDPPSELVEVFSPVRVERIKLLIDDLQARVDPVAAHTVGNHLDTWSKRLAADPSDVPGRGLEAKEATALLEPVERQTIIWRQLLTGAKEPEAFIGAAQRAEVRDELSKQLWDRYRRVAWLLPVLVAGGVFLGVQYAQHPDIAESLVGGLLAVAGTFGVTRAAIVGIVRRGVKQWGAQGLQRWGELMWNRALAVVICRETLLLHELFPEPPPPRGMARLRR